jgi:hypothetical protein
MSFGITDVIESRTKEFGRINDMDEEDKIFLAVKSKAKRRLRYRGR